LVNSPVGSLVSMGILALQNVRTGWHILELKHSVFPLNLRLSLVEE
jgi:hypothetical protein